MRPLKNTNGEKLEKRLRFYPFQGWFSSKLMNHVNTSQNLDILHLNNLRY
jgi:hypothetical protein